MTNTLKIPEISIYNFELSEDAKQLLDELIPVKPMNVVTDDAPSWPINTQTK